MYTLGHKATYFDTAQPEAWKLTYKILRKYLFTNDKCSMCPTEIFLHHAVFKNFCRKRRFFLGFQMLKYMEDQIIFLRWIFSDIRNITLINRTEKILHLKYIHISIHIHHSLKSPGKFSVESSEYEYRGPYPKKSLGGIVIPKKRNF